jgi:hypothetical protein
VEIGGGCGTFASWPGSEGLFLCRETRLRRDIIDLGLSTIVQALETHIGPFNFQITGCISQDYIPSIPVSPR